MSGQQLTDDVCKKIIRRIALKHNIEPRLITTELMDEADKDDMRAGNLPVYVLDKYVELWTKRKLARTESQRDEPYYAK